MKQIDLIKQVFEKLVDIDYVILRNYQFLIDEREPEKLSENALDMVVSEKDFQKFKQVLVNQGFIEAKQSFSKRHHHFVLIKNKLMVSLDVQVEGVHWNDIFYLKEILENKEKKSFFYVPNKNNIFIMLLLHSVLGKRRFKPEYKETLEKIKSEVDEEYILEKLSKIFLKKDSEWLFEQVQNGNYSQILNKKYYFIRKFIEKDVLTFAKLTLRWLWIKKRPLKNYPLISIIGPDGSGKSTATKEVLNYLNKFGYKTSLIYTGRGRDHILPISNIGYKYKKREIKKETQEKPKKITFKKKLLYTMSAPVFTLDLALRYLLRILPKRRSEHIVITDRYCSDITLMKNVPFWYKRILLSIFPKPTINIFLYNTAEVLHERRLEESVDELNRQLEIFNKFKYSLRVKTEDKERDTNKIISFVVREMLKRGF